MGKFVNNTEEFFKYCEENEVEFVDFRFTDIKGAWHHISYRMSAVDEGILNALPFDGSSIENWQPIEKSDMILKPDVPTAFLDPFTADSTIIVICDVYDIYKNELYERCPRSIAKKTLKYMEESGVGDDAFFGPENEFFIFDDVKIWSGINQTGYRVESEEGEWSADTTYEYGNMGHRPGTKGGYFPTMPTDSMVDLRAEMMLLLEEVGLTVMLGHHEVAQAQGEIGIKFGNMIEAADNVQKYKYVVKMVAHLNGKSATFMPKPLYGDNGNGMHVHQSIWKNGKNMFYKEGEYANLSEMALQYLGGVFRHSGAVASFTNPSTNSYKRLVPGYEAPSILTYSSQNRSAACRIPYGAGEMATRIETRFPDSTACPYLWILTYLNLLLMRLRRKIFLKCLVHLEKHLKVFVKTMNFLSQLCLKNLLTLIEDICSKVKFMKMKLDLQDLSLKLLTLVKNSFFKEKGLSLSPLKKYLINQNFIKLYNKYNY